MPAEILAIVIVTVFLLFMAIMFVVTMRYGNLWFQAYMSRANIPLIELIGMTFRKVPPKIIVQAKIMAVQTGLEVDDSPGGRKGPAISTQKLEAHYLAGGNVTQVVKALVAAKRGDIELDFEQACAIDLAGRDVLDEVRQCMAPDDVGP